MHVGHTISVEAFVSKITDAHHFMNFRHPISKVCNVISMPLIMSCFSAQDLA